VTEIIPPAHRSIFLNEFSDFFTDRKLLSFMDATLGAGGHSERILQLHPEIEYWIGIDQDIAALEIAKKRLSPLLKGKKAIFLHSSFHDACSFLIKEHLRFDGIFLDIGVSSMQLDQAQRGFSFRSEGPLDMRMNQDDDLNAEIILNRWDCKKLATIFAEYGEEPKAKKAAQMICTARQKKSLKTTTDLVKALEGLWLNSRKHPATRIFQALRIAVNSELEQLEQALPKFLDLLNEHARLGVISFHSLEDRIVKLCFRERSKQLGWSVLTPKPLEPTSKEIRYNPRSRSAKLRFIEKTPIMTLPSEFDE
jgi:16S rRNA (cytosine1402-N4)-methyltransferase